MQYGSVMAKQFKQESMKTLHFCNLKDVVDGARDPDQMLRVLYLYHTSDIV